MTDLKPCPFCGSTKGIEFTEGSTYRWILASCVACGANAGETKISSDHDMDKSRAYATEEWNRRTPPPGYVLVPVEPTEEMIEIGKKAYDFRMRHMNQNHVVVEVIKAVIAAAQQKVSE